MGWKSTLLLDTLKAFLPFQGTLRRLKRRLFPHQKEPENNGLAFEQGLKMLSMLRRAEVNLHEQTVLELGSGWQPVIPILFYLAGCRKIILTDLRVSYRRDPRSDGGPFRCIEKRPDCSRSRIG